MKKILASTLAILMTASMLTACGDSDASSAASESKADTASSAAAESAAESEAESAAESTADSAAESTAESEAESSEEVAQPKDISEMPATLKNYDTASLKFTTDMNVEDFFGPFAEDKGKGPYEGTDESHIEFAVEEVAGVPMLKVRTLDQNNLGTGYKIPKVRFDMSKLFAGHEDLLPTIFTIKIDFVTKAVGNFVGDDGSEALVPGNFMGAVCTQPTDGKGGNGWNQLIEFAEAEWTSEWGSYEVKVRPGIKDAAKFVDSTDPQYLSIMRWSIPNDADFYIADITFEDEDGNVIECPYGK